MFCEGGRFSGVEGGMRGWSPPGVPRSEGRGAGVLAVNGAAAFKVGFVPDDEAPVLGSAPAPLWRRAPSSTLMLARPRVPRPSPPRCGVSPVLVSARRSECVRCPKRRRSARAACSAAPKAHRKHSGNTTKAPGHRTVSWRYSGHRGFNPLRFGHIPPNNPINRPTSTPASPKNNRTPGTTHRDPRTSL